MGEWTRSLLSSHRFLLCLWQLTTRCHYGIFNPHNPVAGWGWEKNKEENLTVLCKMEFSFFLAACQANKKKFFFKPTHELKRLSRNICTVKLLTPKKSNILFILYKLKWKIKPIWANVQNLQSKRKVLLKSIHFRNDGIKYGGCNSLKQLKFCPVKL